MRKMRSKLSLLLVILAVFTTMNSVTAFIPNAITVKAANIPSVGGTVSSEVTVTDGKEVLANAYAPVAFTLVYSKGAGKFKWGSILAFTPNVTGGNNAKATHVLTNRSTNSVTGVLTLSAVKNGVTYTRRCITQIFFNPKTGLYAHHQYES